MVGGLGTCPTEMAFCLSWDKVLHCESTNLLYVGFFKCFPLHEN